MFDIDTYNEVIVTVARKIHKLNHLQDYDSELFEDLQTKEEVSFNLRLGDRKLLLALPRIATEMESKLKQRTRKRKLPALHRC